MCEPFQENDDIIELPCNHCFFVEPIMKWLTEDSCECPVCRYKFDSMEKNVGEEENIEINEEENENIYYEYEELEQINMNNFFDFINNVNNNSYNNIISANESISNDEIYPMNFDTVDENMDVD